MMDKPSKPFLPAVTFFYQSIFNHSNWKQNRRPLDISAGRPPAPKAHKPPHTALLAGNETVENMSYSNCHKDPEMVQDSKQLHIPE